MSNELANEIDEMLNAVSSTEPEPEPKAETVEEPQLEEAQGEEDQGEVEEEEPTPEVEEEPPQEEPPEEGPSELDALRAQVNELSTQLVQQPPAPPPPPPVEEPKKPKGMFEDEDFEEALGDQRKFEKIINTHVERMVGERVERAVQQYLSAIPNVVSNQVNQAMALKGKVESFYEQNPDLSQVRPYVGFVATKLQSDHQDWTLDKLFEESAKAVRETLRLKGIPQEALSGEKTIRVVEEKKPAFVKRGAKQQKNEPKMSQLQQDIMELIELP